MDRNEGSHLGCATCAVYNGRPLESMMLSTMAVMKMKMKQITELMKMMKMMMQMAAMISP